MTVESVKRKMCFHCGTPPSAQALQLKDERGRLLAALDDDTRKLGFYSPRDGFTLHIIDTDPTSLSGACWGRGDGSCGRWEGGLGGRSGCICCRYLQGPPGSTLDDGVTPTHPPNPCPVQPTGGWRM